MSVTNRTDGTGNNMSLPTYGKFYKDGKVVGTGFCNPGWFLTDNGLKSCIIQSMDNAWSYFEIPSSGETVNRYGEELSKFFTTPEDLKSFDRISILGIDIPRDVAMQVYFKTEGWEDTWISFMNSLKEQQSKNNDPVQ